MAMPYSLLAQQPVNDNTSYSGKSTKFAIMVSDVIHFRAAIQTAQAMDINKNGFTFGVVVVGELAKDLVVDKSLKSDIDQSIQLGVKTVVCENALTFFDVPIKQLDHRLLTVKNAWIYMFELKDKGYNTLSV